MLDPSLEGEQPVDAEVHRVPGPAPSGSRFASALMLQSAWERWWARSLAEVAARVRDVDAVYAWAQPYATLHAAARLEKPWVADLSDPWALDEMWFYATGLHRRRELRRMRETLRSAGAVVMSAPEAAKRVRQAFPELHGVTSVPFGYDAAAFAGEAPARTDDRFRIVHVGEFHTEIGRRQERHRTLRRLLGGDSTADVLTRSPLHLMRALERLDTTRIELHLAGKLSAADEEILAGSPLVHRHGYVPHADAVALMRSADLLFQPMQDVPGRAGLVPGKTYEYLAARRPILAAVPAGDARDLLSEAGAHVVEPIDEAAMAAVIRDELEHPSAPPSIPLELYEYAAVTHRLTEILDGVLGR